MGNGKFDGSVEKVGPKSRKRKIQGTLVKALFWLRSQDQAEAEIPLSAAS